MSLKDDIEAIAKVLKYEPPTTMVLNAKESLYRIKAALAFDDGSNKLETLKDLLKVQGQDGNWNYCDYMTGMYNGMELSVAILEGRDPNYRDCPKDDGPPREGDAVLFPAIGYDNSGIITKYSHDHISCGLQVVILMRAEEVERRIK